VQGLTLCVGPDWHNNHPLPRNVAKRNALSGKTNANIMEERSK